MNTRTRAAVLMAAIALTLTSCSGEDQATTAPIDEATASESVIPDADVPGTLTRMQQVQDGLIVGLTYQLNRLRTNEDGALKAAQKVMCLGLLNGMDRQQLVDLIKESDPKLGRRADEMITDALKAECPKQLSKS